MLLVAALLLLLARPSQANPDWLECSRAITAGSTIMGHTVQESTSASLRLTRGSNPIDCGGTLSAGETAGFELSGHSGQYLIEAVASAGTGAWGIGSMDAMQAAPSCSGQRDVNKVSAAYTVPLSGAVTVRAVWATAAAGPVHVSPDCMYTISSVHPAATCAQSTHGCCADGATAKDDAVGTNCITYLPAACSDGSVSEPCHERKWSGSCSSFANHLQVCRPGLFGLSK
jgi:hypothetical protein